MVPDGQVILLTGFASVESAAAAVRSGAWAYLMKPCATPDLLRAIEQALRQVDLLKEKRELVRRAQVAEKLAAIGTLTAGLSHEIKNPLNAAGLQLTVLERRLKKFPLESQSALAEPLKLVQDEIARLTRILDEFLQFARPREIVLAAVDLASLLTRVVDLLAAAAEREEVSLERGWENSVSVFADEGRLQQAILNLVLNAIQATPRGGSVRIETNAQGREVELAIEDTGPGIPEELRRRIFEPFFTTKAGGSGLGLPLVYSIVEQHGGSISIDDGHKGGARIVVRLPSENSYVGKSTR